ncbi:MAG: outer membrane beta-barrel protein [Bacteroidetes bacterium]|nr:outer membrane beta-barrel protein [Bacteroidota bacterium]MBS1973279.1 outer membrane beta-barrel protein [Bacteroidota bacterium]
MERNFYNEDFEDLIRQKAGQYKMYPSDKVWKNINASLHTRKRWFIASMFTLITGILFFAGKELLAPSSPVHVSTKAPDKKADKSSSNTINSGSNNESSITRENKTVEISIAPAFAVFSAEEILEKKRPEVVAVSQASTSVNTISGALAELAATKIEPLDFLNDAGNGLPPVYNNYLYTRKAGLLPIGKQTNINIEAVTPGSIDPGTKTIQTYSSGMVFDKKQMAIIQNTAPYELISPKKLNRKYWQLYITPILTYRTLSGAAFAAAKSDIQNGPIATASQDANPNLYANNKPAIGFEIGSDLLFRFTRNLSFKAGLQFNYSRYTINAYASNTQPAIIALNFNGYPGSTITAYTNIGTVGGKAVVNLQNQYFQLSVPLGFEMRIIGNEKLQLNIGATVQPSYLLNRDSYLLTADFANYTQEPSLFRRWNVNAAVEAFISYKTGKIRWQVGPQFRYQLLSTYTTEYPINENLKGFGIKFGISKTIW